jgi:hypothetical protein
MYFISHFGKIISYTRKESKNILINKTLTTKYGQRVYCKAS